MKGTTILVVRKGGRVVVAGDGQVTMGDTVLKHKARKVRRLFNDQVIAGFGGNTESVRHEKEALIVPAKDSRALAESLNCWHHC